MDACAERTGAKARVKLVNRRAVAVRINAPQAALKERTVPGLGDIISIGMSSLSRALGGPNEGALIPPGGQIVLEFDDAPQQFDMSVDNAGIVWSVLFAAASGVQGGWQALGDAANAINGVINTSNAVQGKGWEELARQGLSEFFKSLAKTASGALKVVLRLASAVVSTIILAIRGTIDSFLGLAGNSFAVLIYAPGFASTTATTNGSAVLSLASRLSMAGLGPITVGMTLADAQRAAGVATEVKRPPDYCGVLTAASVPGVQFQSLPGEDRIAAVLIQNESISTLSGIHVGSSETDVRRAYGDGLLTTRYDILGTAPGFVYRPDASSPYAIRLRLSRSTGVVEHMMLFPARIINSVEFCA